MNRRQGWLWIAVGAFLALLAGFLVFMTMRGTAPAKQAPAPENEGPKVRVVVAARDIPRHAVIGEADVSVDEVPAKMVPDEAVVGGIEGVIGKVARRTISKQEILVASMLTTYIPGSGEEVVFATLGDQGQMVLAREDQVLMAILPLDLMSTRFLEVGNRVDILVSLPQRRERTSEGMIPSGGAALPVEGPPPLGGSEAPSESTAPEEEGREERSQPELITFYTIQNVEVVAIKYASGEMSSGARPRLSPSSGGKDEAAQAASIPQALLIALDPQDALILKHLLDRGDVLISMVMRAPTNDQLFETQPVDQDYVYDRYRLPR